ncbi:MAG: hypothetical protein ACE5R6_19830 [Candidatus Heimdallarchaeota archaeon]
MVKKILKSLMHFQLIRPQTVPELTETLLYSHRYLYSRIDELVAEGKVKIIGREGRR